MRDDELRAALRAEAAAHRPDRDAMLDRITASAMTNEAGRRSGSRVRIGAAAAAVAALLAGGGVANWALAGDDATPVPLPPPPSVAVTTTTPTSPPPTSSPPTSKATSKPTSKATSKPPASTTPSRNTRVEQGPLWSDGSVDPDSRGASVVTLKTTERLTSLEVVIRVARTDGLTSRGGTKHTPGASVTTTVTEEPGAFLYRFVLSSADVLEPGTYTFIAKYAYRADGRDAGDDTYEAKADTEGNAALDVYGDFY
ncbi:hypothetical protein AB0M02_06295 [Actinoplanes sp. NPDC051861]|uniref:hypothetical protein n=1 Tax=Actinoplanes sp. NPDC051861 TaxID=3155170 RepID=UPI00343EE034